MDTTGSKILSKYGLTIHLITLKNGVNWIENQVVNLIKMSIFANLFEMLF